MCVGEIAEETQKETSEETQLTTGKKKKRERPD